MSVTIRTRHAFHALLATALLGWAAVAPAQEAKTAASGAVTASPAPASPAAAAAAAPKAEGGIRSQNIFEVKPEASADPNYLNQTNGERNKVQPGNNAPMWRQVSGGVTGRLL